MLALAVPMMLFVFGEIPIASWLVGRYVAAGWQSRVFALQYVLSLGVSALVVPLIAVLYEATGGFAAFFTALAAAAAVVAAAALVLPRTSPAPVRQPAAAS
jgi:hypothetical protein